MKKLVKSSLEELALEMPVLTELEQMAFIGGDKYVFNDKGELIETEECDEDYFVVGFGDTAKELQLSGDLTLTQDNSGIGFEGSAMQKDVFEFLAQNTTVEWGYSFNEENNTQGFLYTSNDETTINGLPYKDGYDSFVHNHGSNLTAEQRKDHTLVDCYDHPSVTDKEDATISATKGYKNMYIYNAAKPDESMYHWYSDKSVSQEEELRKNGYIK